MSKFSRIVLLGGLALAGAPVAAGAADDLLPAEEPESVKICDTYGVGFWYIPGTDTCLQVGGYVRLQLNPHTSNVRAGRWEGDPFMMVDSDEDSQADTFSFYTRGLFTFDARTETSYGTLRSFLQFRGTAIDEDNPTAQLDIGFLQFAGFTAGLAPSFFYIERVGSYLSGFHQADFDEDQVLFGYTAELGNGISASIALESADLANDAGDPAYAGDETVEFTDTRTELPVVVANLRVKQAWGSAQLSGAVGQQKSRLEIFDDDDLPIARKRDSDTGWAVSAGIRANLPALGGKDAFSLKLAYSDTLSYYTLGGGHYIGDSFAWTGNLDDPDGLFSAGVKAFTVFGGFIHHWRDTLRSTFAVSYTDIEFGTGGPDEAWGMMGTANLVWSSVKNLDVGLELIYSHVDADGDAAQMIGIDGTGQSFEDDAFGAIFRLQRNFGK